jgi:hypothetical protein
MELDKHRNPLSQPLAQKPTSRDLIDWLRYFTLARQRGIAVSLKEVAHATGYSYGYVRRKHAEIRRKVTKR